jgi:PHD/YefM family antitoxin component YafN of YafNO toxin-antitoxin module
MYIKSSASIRNNYNEIATLCKETSEPVYLTKNGEGDLVVMDIKAFEKRQRDLKIAEDLVQIRNSRISGAKTYTIEEVDAFLGDATIKRG